MPYETLQAAAEMRLYRSPGARGGVVMVGGVGGGFDTPAAGLYPRLAEELQADGLAALRVRFRDPRDLDAAVADVRAGVRVLEQRAVTRIALVGHSLGGAVVITAAVEEPSVRAVVALATQSAGTRKVSQLERPLLLVHGAEDTVLPWVCSLDVHRRARTPKELVVVEGAGHCLDEAAEDVHDVVAGWLRARLDEP